MSDKLMIGQKLRKLREFNNYTQEYMAIELGVEQNTYCRYEKSEIQMKPERLKRAAEILHVPVEVFFSPEPLTFNIHGNHSANGYVEQHNTDIGMQEKLLTHIEERSKQLEALFAKTLVLFEMFTKNSDHL